QMANDPSTPADTPILEEKGYPQIGDVPQAKASPMWAGEPENPNNLARGEATDAAFQGAEKPLPLVLADCGVNFGKALGLEHSPFLQSADIASIGADLMDAAQRGEFGWEVREKAAEAPLENTLGK